MKPKVVLIRWIDSCGCGGWQPRKEAANWFQNTAALVHISVGFLWEKTDDYIAIIQSMQAVADGAVGELLQIPRCAVLSMKTLHTLPDDIPWP